MRECPCCGYIDPPYWRHVRQRLFTDCCALHDFKELHKTLGMRIEKEINIIGHGNKGQPSYIYHYVPTGQMVQRIHISDSIDGKSWREPEQEKAMAKRGWYNKGQTKLASVCENKTKGEKK